jgi:hypothetical protein
MTRGGLPHSEIPGSKLICSSPGLIAACHVLHRLLAPRHSPYTLSSLTIRKSELTITGLFAYKPVCVNPMQNTARVCGRKKLPFAEYSVVKDQLGGRRPPNPPLAHSPGPEGPAPFRSLKPGVLFATLKSRKLITSSLGRCATRAARSRQKPATTKRRTSACAETSQSLTRSPITFQRTRLRSFELRRDKPDGPPQKFVWPSRSSPSRGFLAPRFGGAKAGGEYRSRTGDLLVANQALSQLS